MLIQQVSYKNYSIYQKRQSGKRRKSQCLRGFPTVSGVGIGQVVVVYPLVDLESVPNRKIEDEEIDQEITIFEKALEATREDVQLLSSRMKVSLPSSEMELFGAYQSILDSIGLDGKVINKIREGQWAQGALRKVIEKYIYQFEEMDDEYLKERMLDIKDIGRRVLSHLQAIQPKKIEYPENAVSLW